MAANVTPNSDVAAVWTLVKNDRVFRERLKAAPDETLRMEGFNPDDQDLKVFVAKLQAADAAALEKAIASGDTNPTC